jgi:hypothetical protein
LFDAAKKAFAEYLKQNPRVPVRGVVLDIYQKNTPCTGCWDAMTSSTTRDDVAARENWLSRDHWQVPGQDPPDIVVVRLGHAKTYESSMAYHAHIGGSYVPINDDNVDRMLFPVVTEDSFVFGTPTNTDRFFPYLGALQPKLGLNKGRR